MVKKGLKPIAVAEDMVSGRRFRVWTDQRAEEERGPLSRLFRGGERRQFVIEQVDSGDAAATFASWRDVERWHDQTLISTGWTMLDGASSTAAKPR